MNKMMKSILAFPLAGLFTANVMAADTSGDQEPITTVTTPTYYALGDSDGGVLNYFKTKYTAGSASDYDILLLGDSLSADASLKTTVSQALTAGKEVIFDGSVGSTKAAALAGAVLGSSVQADAIMFKTAPAGDGYLMTPVALNAGQFSTDSLSDEKTVATVNSDNTPDQIFQ